MTKPIIVLGAGGHAKVVIDVLRLSAVRILGIVDEDLAAVNQLGISAQLAFPSTFIVDKQGQVRLSYVGSDPTDRPSIKALLAQLGDLQD